MIPSLIASMVLQGAELPQTPAYAEALRAAKEVIARVTTDLKFGNGRLAGCTITATSGVAAIDRYVCDATRHCVAGQPKNTDLQQRCLDEELDKLAGNIATAATNRNKGK